MDPEAVRAAIQAGLDEVFDPAHHDEIFSSNPVGAGHYIRGGSLEANVVAATRRGGPCVGILIFSAPGVELLVDRLHLCFGATRVPFGPNQDGIYASVLTPQEQVEAGVRPVVILA